MAVARATDTPQPGKSVSSVLLSMEERLMAVSNFSKALDALCEHASVAGSWEADGDVIIFIQMELHRAVDGLKAAWQTALKEARHE